MPVGFIHGMRFEDLPPELIRQAKRCLVDLVGVAAAGRHTALSRIVHGFACRQMAAAGQGVRLIFDGRRASPTAAAYAGASTIDAFDAHDGHRLTKGHAGAALLPTLLALTDSSMVTDGRAFLAALVVGYEIAIRAGIALHATASDYHTSGAWNALGCAAIAARCLPLTPDQTRHALGTAEYHGPRSQMMRCIDSPSMVKDGSGWGALSGLSAAYLAQDGFTGAPAALMDHEIWAELGVVWRMAELYFKPWPVCRWAQPAVEAVSGLMVAHGVDGGAIDSVEIRTFHTAVRLGTKMPASTEEAQYALGFPVAAALVHGRLGADQIVAEGLRDPAVMAMLGRIRVEEDVRFSALFPAARYARVTLALKDGRRLQSGAVAARGDPEQPMADPDISAKFRALARDLPAGRVRAIEQAIAVLDTAPDALAALLDAVLAPLGNLD